jgi:hypothetical protein
VLADPEDPLRVDVEVMMGDDVRNPFTPVQSISECFGRKAERTNPMSNTDALCLDPFLQKGVHLVPDPYYVNAPVEASFDKLLGVDEGERIRGPGCHIDVDIAVVAHVSASDGAKDAKGDDTVPVGVPGLEVFEEVENVIPVHVVLLEVHMLTQRVFQEEPSDY